MEPDSVMVHPLDSDMEQVSDLDWVMEESVDLVLVAQTRSNAFRVSSGAVRMRIPDPYSTNGYITIPEGADLAGLEYKYSTPVSEKHHYSVQFE
ncbi:hypothetical protein CDAR_278171 [Caerostris darwini]|uniref:Uncharacterized protein n=1 Tax=Caerostris darwini TaxID=1538125 RepID=A0AAV4WNF7_9ARAC|nr:hypothetical protein CDAR_278171 [Caerostris darwini]